MALFSRKKKQPKEIEVSIRKVKDDNGEKYMHIGDFIHLLEEYQKGVELIDTKILQELIDQLKTA